MRLKENLSEGQIIQKILRTKLAPSFRFEVYGESWKTQKGPCCVNNDSFRMVPLYKLSAT